MKSKGHILSVTYAPSEANIHQVRRERGSMKKTYVHGYDHRENIRLQDQAATLVELLHSDTSYPAESRVLEAGCGVGAQTVTLARSSPNALITSVDISEASVAEARRKVAAAGLTNVQFERADIFHLPYGTDAFDHIFVCFVLEHLSRPVEALQALKKPLRQGGTITVIEGDHGSVFFHPDSEAAHQAIRCQVELQRRAGGNAMVGRELYPLLRQAGYGSIRVSPRMVYVDASKPELVEGFTKKTFTAMIEGVRDSVIKAGIIEPQVFENGIRDLYRTTESDGVFCYTFFKAIGNK
jgi:ubiquinone/menaquinone biosynthesis C-methylase UbiE